ncbi:hypothetical protein AMAG_16083 [Allomyces macrogynus ATCC 38327]|uniref:U6 snRNA-associated Sm-like protein LSm1 n=1 Tax=Allomyces macrogynus (strain ATCC 38327) TaxID=578462 RepID=A0A0L0TAD1_ALLM3|nr:hypothetical protein AMAG_16083 [Allomyces macrogynus ATCC 38327]|eukprot:KNE71778.1 hypothetical protein AMAG_16083 [Allomyces macrogynus ATCC 38327]
MTSPHFPPPPPSHGAVGPAPLVPPPGMPMMGMPPPSPSHLVAPRGMTPPSPRARTATPPAGMRPATPTGPSAAAQAHYGSPRAPGSAVSEMVLPGSASLLDCIDKRLLVILRDGRNLTGILRSYDQFANLVFQDTIERIYAGDCYGDIPRGVFLVRGENVVLLGEIDGDREDSMPIREAPIEDVLSMQRAALDARQATLAIEAKALHAKGFCTDHDKNDMY